MRNLSVITAVEESDRRDSSVVRRPIEIVSTVITLRFFTISYIIVQSFISYNNTNVQRILPNIFITN